MMPTAMAPDVPPKTPPELAEYLRRLRTWAFTEIDKKISKDEATAHVVLTPSDEKTPTKVYAITVDSSGALHTTAVPLGGGKP